MAKSMDARPPSTPAGAPPLSKSLLMSIPSSNSVVEPVGGAPAVPRWCIAPSTTIGAPAPGVKSAEGERYGTEIYRLNEDLLQAAFRLTKDVDLADNDVAKASRAKYSEPAAAAPPQVSIYDCRRHPWVTLPVGTTAYEKDPD